MFVRATAETEERASEAAIPEEFWSVDDHAGFAADWQMGQFAAKPFRGEPDVRWRAHVVEFCKEDVEAIGGSFDRTSNADASSVQSLVDSESNKGGPPLSERWPEFVSEMCLWVYEGNDFAGLKPGRLIEKINKRLSERGVEEIAPSTAYAAAKSVLAALGQAALGQVALEK